MIRKVYQFAFFFFFCFTLSAQSDSLKVLFIGNSYTYFWNLPHQINALAASKNIPLSCDQSTNGGVNLGHHWNSERNLESKSMIRSSRYNHVVLQDHSLRAFLEPDSLYKYGNLLGDEIKRSNAQSYIYLTWARKDNPLMQMKNNQAYIQLANQIGAKVVPVGPAWEKSRMLRPELELYDPDGSHPSAIGAYLSACVFYAVFTGESPIGLTSRLTARDKDGGYLFLNVLPMVDALFLQQVAWEVTQLYKT